MLNDSKFRNKVLKLLELGTDFDSLKYSGRRIKTYNNYYQMRCSSYKKGYLQEKNDYTNITLELINAREDECMLVIDIFKNSFGINTGELDINDYKIKITDLDTVSYPLTEESFFQLGVLYDLKDLTMDEVNAIINIAQSIPEFEEIL